MISFNCAHLVTLSVASACLLLKHKWLTYLISGALEIDKFFLWTFPPLFGCGEWTRIFLGAPSQDDFFPPIVLRCVLDAFLKKRMALATYLKVVPEVLKEGEY